MRSLILFLAQGFAVGRIPLAPGTFGSVVGFGWFLLLLLPGRLTVFLAGLLAGLALSIWACGRAERILGQTDPGSIVLDEITAMPLAFLGWVGWVGVQQGHLPRAGSFVTGSAGVGSLLVFLAFRGFDIAKPWPVGALQRLPGGWGVTLDDVMAAVYAAIIGTGCGAVLAR
jgi:phosphatidylglycerophosphatase A